MGEYITKYGVINPDKYNTFEVKMAASAVIKAKGCNFIVRDTSGYYAMAAATGVIDAIIVNAVDMTCSSTAGATKLVAIPAAAAPLCTAQVLTGTIAQTDCGATCDLVVSSDVIGINVDASSVDPIQILEVNVTEGYAVIQPNITKVIPAAATV